MRALGESFDRITVLGLAALVLFTPLAFGSVETWAVAIVQTTIFLIGALWLAARVLEPSADRSDADGLDRTVRAPDAAPGAALREGRPWARLGPLIAVFLGLVVLQLVPWPRSIVSIVSPRASGLYERTIPGYTGAAHSDFDEWLLASDAARGEISRPAGGSRFEPLTYSPPVTRDRLVIFAAWAIVFLVAADRFRDAARRRRMIVWITFVGVGVAILGLFQMLAWNGKILWLRLPPIASARPFGPFVNPNHFAGYMELIVPLALGLLLLLSVRSNASSAPDGAEDAARHEKGRGRFDPWAALRSERDEDRERLPWTETQRLPKAILLAFLLALSIVSIVLSLSRGGFLATLLTFLLFAKALVPPAVGRRFTPRAVAGTIVLMVAVVAISFWLGSSLITRRAASIAEVQSDPSTVLRFDTWVRSLEMFREHAATGVGLGAFETAFAGYYPPGTYGIWREAHNDYVQILSEMGVVGTIPFVMLIVLFLRLYLVPAAAHSRRPDRYLTLGLAMGVVSILLHSFVDFNLQIPAVAFLFVLVGGMLAGTRPPAVSAPASRGRRAPRLAASLGAVVLLVLAVYAGWRGFRKAAAERTAARAAAMVPAPISEITFERVTTLAAKEPRVLATLGDSALAAFDVISRTGHARRSEAQRQLAMAEAAYRRIATLSPLSAWSWWGLGEVYARRSQIERETGTFALERLVPSREEDFDRLAHLALASFRTAILLEPNSYEVHDDLALLYQQEGLRPAALDAYRESARIMPLYYRHDYGSPDALDEDIYGAIAAGMEDALNGPGVVSGSEVRQILGDGANLRGKLAEAERQYRLALALPGNHLVHETLEFEIGEILRREGKTQEAVTWLTKATARESVAWRAWRSLGDLRAAAGDHCGAFDAYSASLARVPAKDAVRDLLLAVREQAACGHVAEAIAQLRSMRTTMPGSLDARELLVDLLRQGGRKSEALEEARALAVAAPSNGVYRDLVSTLELEAAAASGAPAR